jgi:hypothetical protein
MNAPVSSWPGLTRPPTKSEPRASLMRDAGGTVSGCLTDTNSAGRSTWIAGASPAMTMVGPS